MNDWTHHQRFFHSSLWVAVIIFTVVTLIIMCLQVDEEPNLFRSTFSNLVTIIFVVIKAIPTLKQVNEA